MILRLSHRVSDILRENYDTVVYMERLNEALRRIDASFLLALADHEGAKPEQQYRAAWDTYTENLVAEQHNITVPGEAEAVATLVWQSQRYRTRGDEFFAAHRLLPETPGGYISRKVERRRSGGPAAANRANLRPDH